MKIDVSIPAFNEEDAIVHVLKDIPTDFVREVIVVNNNSSDNTSKNAKAQGATVLNQEKKGYGWACLTGIEYLNQKEEKPDVVVFMDGDYSDYPEEMKLLVEPIVNNDYAMIIGSRSKGKRQRGSMTPQQIFGNWLATRLIKLLYRVKYSDLGPFRAIKYTDLIEMDMQDKTYGWTVEMQAKAAKRKLKVGEIPVNYRVRIGKSKVSGTLKGTIFAGYKIITTIFKLR